MSRQLTPEELSRERGREFRFRHMMIRDAVYEATTKEVRACDHEVFGRRLAERSPDRLAEVEGIVGYHLEMAHRYRIDIGVLEGRAEKSKDSRDGAKGPQINREISQDPDGYL